MEKCHEATTTIIKHVHEKKSRRLTKEEPKKTKKDIIENSISERKINI